MTDKQLAEMKERADYLNHTSFWHQSAREIITQQQVDAPALIAALEAWREIGRQVATASIEFPGHGDYLNVDHSDGPVGVLNIRLREQARTLLAAE